jgi:hypothetical protein
MTIERSEYENLLDTMRRDQADLYAIVGRLRERVAVFEAMTIALAWTHPDGTALLAQLRHWMALPDEAQTPDAVREHKERESERVLSVWKTLMGAAPAPNGRPPILH